MVDLSLKYKSLFDLWTQTCSKYYSQIAFMDFETNETITYGEAFNKMCFLAEKFQNFGVKNEDKISLFAVNSTHWLILEQAIISLNATCVSKSSEIDIKELDYVFTNSDSVALITDDYKIIEYFIVNNPQLVEQLKFILYFGKKSDNLNNSKIIYLFDLFNEMENIHHTNINWIENPDNISYINYTSGTSATPKGAMLPNIGMSYVVEQLQKFNDIQVGAKFVVTFPLSSAGGKSFVLLCFSRGCKIIFTKYKNYYDVLKNEKPQYLHCAPKILQTMHQKFNDYIKSKGIFFNYIYSLSFMISSFIQQFERKFFFQNKFLFIRFFFNLFKKLLDKNIYKQIRNTLFIDEVVLFVGSAHLAKPLEDFFQIIGIPLVQHYGLTETTGLAVSNTIKSQKEKPYTVGVAFDGTIIKIIDPETFVELPPQSVGLITLGGIEITKGYYNNPEATKKAILPNGFLNTGDLGFVDKEGFLTVLSRYDDVIVMSNGYNVYAPLLENQAKDSEFLSQIVIAGHGKPYLVALIVLNIKQYDLWCSHNKIKNIDPNANSDFKTFIINHLNEKIMNKKDFRYYEKIKKVYFLKEDFSVQNGMLTGTLKVKYKKVCNTYIKEIDSLYERV